MKRWFDGATGDEIYVGTAREIRALYGSMKRAMKVGHTNCMPWYSDMPRFDHGRMYELRIDEDGFYTVSLSGLEEPIDKKALNRLIRKEVLKRCEQLRGQGYRYIATLSDRCVSINDTVDFPIKPFLKALEEACRLEITKSLCLHMNKECRLWLKSTDEIKIL